MARLDLYRVAEFDGYLLEVQANLLSRLNSVVTVPMIPLARSPKPMKILNPVFDIAGQAHVMATQFLAAMPRNELGAPVASLSDRHYYDVNNALDLLLSGS